MTSEIHKMRSRIITSPAFTDSKVLGAILFERTMRSEIDGLPTAQYLWEKRGVVPFLKIDKGLEDKANDVQLMKPMPGLEELLKVALLGGTQLVVEHHDVDVERFALRGDLLSFALADVHRRIRLVAPHQHFRHRDGVRFVHL